MTWADSLQWQQKTAADKQRPPRMSPSWTGEALQRSVQAAAATFPIFCGSFSKCPLRWGLRGLINDLLMGKCRSWGGNVPFAQGHSQIIIKLISRYDCKINWFSFFYFIFLYNCCKNDVVMWDFHPCDSTNSCQTLVRGVLLSSEGGERQQIISLHSRFIITDSWVSLYELHSWAKGYIRPFSFRFENVKLLVLS